MSGCRMACLGVVALGVSGFFLSDAQAKKRCGGYVGAPVQGYYVPYAAPRAGGYYLYPTYVGGERYFYLPPSADAGTTAERYFYVPPGAAGAVVPAGGTSATGTLSEWVPGDPTPGFTNTNE